jgi:4-amino-4-deoxy-L-arabinose transferase-like glycosyltransferase
VLLTFALVERKSVRPGGWLHLRGAALFAIIVSAWLVPAAVAGGREYMHTILLKQTVSRTVQSYSHQNPFYYYMLWLPVYCLPWTPIVALSCVAAFRRWQSCGEVPRLGLVWMLVPIAFFSCVSGKRLNYVLPVAPAMGMLAAWYLGLREEEKGGLARAERSLFAVSYTVVILIGAACIAAMFGASWWLERQYPEAQFSQQMADLLTTPRLVLGVVLVAAPVALAGYGLFRPGWDSIRKAWGLAVSALLLGLPVDFMLLPAANFAKSARPFAAAIEQHAPHGRDIFFYRSELSGVYNLWTGRIGLRVLESGEELREALAETDALIVSHQRRLEKVLSAEEIESYTLAREYVGHRLMILLSGEASKGTAPPSPPSDTFEEN